MIDEEIEQVFKEGLDCENEVTVSEITDMISYMIEIFPKTPLFKQFVKDCELLLNADEEKRSQITKKDIKDLCGVFMLDIMVSIVATIVENYGNKTAKA